MIRETEKDKEDSEVKTNCDVSGGEYALLVGYSNLGVALWKCVQMYKSF